LGSDVERGHKAEDKNFASRLVWLKWLRIILKNRTSVITEILSGPAFQNHSRSLQLTHTGRSPTRLPGGNSGTNIMQVCTKMHDFLCIIFFFDSDTYGNHSRIYPSTGGCTHRPVSRSNWLFDIYYVNRLIHMSMCTSGRASLTVSLTSDASAVSSSAIPAAVSEVIPAAVAALPCSTSVSESRMRNNDSSSPIYD